MLKSAEINSEEIAAKRKLFVENKCHLCQSLSSFQGIKSAPLLVAIKARYSERGLI
jgi:hypothetical protein